MNDLEAATTDQLVDELKKRYPRGLLVAGIALSPEGQDEKFEMHFRGGLTVCIGIAERCRDQLVDEGRRGMFNPDEEEEDVEGP